MCFFSFVGKSGSSISDVFYFPGSEIYELYYNRTNTNIQEFSILISAFKIADKNLTEKCQSATNGNISAISNKDFPNGYKSFENCIYPIIVPKNSAIFLEIIDYYLEKNGDKLEIKTENITENLSTNYLITDKALNPIINFISDGNIEQIGFILTAKILACECSSLEVIIPCNESFTLTAMKESSQYCDGMHCKYTVKLDQNCPSKYFKFHMKGTGRPSMDYVLLSTSDSSFSQFLDFTTTFTSKTTVYLELITGTSLNGLKQALKFEAIFYATKSPSFLPTIYLTEENPSFGYYLTDLNENDALTICGISNDTLEIYAGFTYNAILYDSKNLDNFVGNLETFSLEYNKAISPSKVSESGCFTIYQAVSQFYSSSGFLRLKNGWKISLIKS
uniref:CUB domain-containing protein n=1 Tax=Panagrolaimus sp. PS1159 TaxID=55785 RepID=A0AC35GNK4_9BILA